MWRELWQCIRPHVTPEIVLTFLCAAISSVLPYTGWKLPPAVARGVLVLALISALILVYLIVRNERYLQKNLRGQAEESANWIEAYIAENNKLPPLPVPLHPFVTDYTDGQPISKEMKIRIASMQAWANLAPSDVKMWRQFLEWLGQDPNDYESEVRRLAPPKGNPHSLVYKRPRRQ